MGAMPRPSAAPFTMPANSASPELSAIVFCEMGQRLTARTPHIQTPPHAERLVRRHPAKSVSTKVRMAAPSSCQGKL
eukprot:5184424-Alexandrium_andersonii.AAC.1